MTLFEKKNIKPMLIGIQGEPFDDPDYFYELKLDGIRCIAYLDGTGTDLRNKRNIRLLPKVPELSQIHKQVKKSCILDGELAVIKDGRTDFYEIQKRVMTENPMKIRLAAERFPACFTAFDILYLDGQETVSLPLWERKKLLTAVMAKESKFFAVSHYIQGNGTNFFQLTKKHKLEGIVAKRKDSRYYFDKRTKDWIKIKNMADEDFVICGYIMKSSRMTSLVLGQYTEDGLEYKGHVTLGVSGKVIEQLGGLICDVSPFGKVPAGNEKAVWVRPELVCTVEYMADEGSARRQVVFRGIRTD